MSTRNPGSEWGPLPAHGRAVQSVDVLLHRYNRLEALNLLRNLGEKVRTCTLASYRLDRDEVREVVLTIVGRCNVFRARRALGAL